MDFDTFVGETCRHDNFNKYFDTLIDAIGGIKNAATYCPIEDISYLTGCYKEDPRLNNIPLKVWQTAAGFDPRDCQGKNPAARGSRLRSRLYMLGITGYPCSQGVCLLKRIAERIALDAIEKEKTT